MRAALVSFAVVLMPVITWAGITRGSQPAPAVDESGLMLLAAGLVGAGVTLLRGRRK